MLTGVREFAEAVPTATGTGSCATLTLTFGSRAPPRCCSPWSWSDQRRPASAFRRRHGVRGVRGRGGCLLFFQTLCLSLFRLLEQTTTDHVVCK